MTLETLSHPLSQKMKTKVLMEQMIPRVLLSPVKIFER
jgi:hypothetical protein